MDGPDKGGLISKGISTLVALPIKGAKSLSWANKLFTKVIGGKFCLGEWFGTFWGRKQMPSEIKPPLAKHQNTYNRTQSEVCKPKLIIPFGNCFGISSKIN